VYILTKVISTKAGAVWKGASLYY